jgi:hypothetical protein
MESTLATGKSQHLPPERVNTCHRKEPTLATGKSQHLPPESSCPPTSSNNVIREEMKFKLLFFWGFTPSLLVNTGISKIRRAFIFSVKQCMNRYSFTLKKKVKGSLMGQTHDVSDNSAKAKIFVYTLSH